MLATPAGSEVVKTVFRKFKPLTIEWFKKVAYKLGVAIPIFNRNLTKFATWENDGSIISG